MTCAGGGGVSRRPSYYETRYLSLSYSNLNAPLIADASGALRLHSPERDAPIPERPNPTRTDAIFLRRRKYRKKLSHQKRGVRKGLIKSAL